ncbi:DUF1338 domain-containing protein [Halomonas sp. V046]|uniref:DUF1338 domain-containing protein n=1 Tax=Halomonas sp. V046 TaxID=3459611 RepID=UPI00404517EB
MSEQERFVQQLWLDYIHHHPDVGALRLWPVDAPLEFFSLVTVSQSPWNMDSMTAQFIDLGYTDVERYAMADRGLLVTLLAPPNDGAYLILIELQTTRLSRAPRDALVSLIGQGSATGAPAIGAGRPWPMPDWRTYELLMSAHPLAAWLAIMGPRVHHVGFDCDRLGSPVAQLHASLSDLGLGQAKSDAGIFPVSALVEHRYYPTCSRRLAFADGDEHRVCLGGLSLVQKQLDTGPERSAALLLPHHTRCEVSCHSSSKDSSSC